VFERLARSAGFAYVLFVNFELIYKGLLLLVPDLDSALFLVLALSDAAHRNVTLIANGIEPDRQLTLLHRDRLTVIDLLRIFVGELQGVAPMTDRCTGLGSEAEIERTCRVLRYVTLLVKKES